MRLRRGSGGGPRVRARRIFECDEDGVAGWVLGWVRALQADEAQAAGRIAYCGDVAYLGLDGRLVFRPEEANDGAFPDAQAIGESRGRRDFNLEHGDVDEAEHRCDLAYQFTLCNGDRFDDSVSRGAKRVAFDIDLGLSKLELGLLPTLDEEFVGEPVSIGFEGAAAYFKVRGSAA